MRPERHCRRRGGLERKGYLRELGVDGGQKQNGSCRSSVGWCEIDLTVTGEGRFLGICEHYNEL
jgi:hypothetical protein